MTREKITHGQYALLVSHTPGDVARGVSQKKSHDRLRDLGRSDVRQAGGGDPSRTGQRDRGLDPGPKEAGGSSDGGPPVSEAAD